MTLREHQEQDPSIIFGKAFWGWRNNFASLSIQNIHDFNQARKAKGPHNSQVNLLEKGILDPKKQFWYSLEEMMLEIQNEKKFLYVESLILRERLINAKPFLTHDGRIANRGDFVLMFLGMQPIREEYLKVKVKLTNEFINTFANSLKENFEAIALDEVISTKDAWKKLKSSKAMHKTEDEVQSLILDILRGEGVPTLEQANYVINKYNACPCYLGLKEISDLNTPKMDKLHNELKERVLCK